MTVLERDEGVTPQVRERSQARMTLLVIYANPGFHFPKEYVDRARALDERWQSEAQVAADLKSTQDAEMGDAVERDEDTAMDDDEVPVSPVRRARKSSRSDNSDGPARLPPPDHPIWGVHGIMHGLAVKLGQKNADGTRRQNLLYDARYPRRNAKVHGHNHIEVGQWYPRQLAASWRGAHGHSQAGIYGDEQSGAYSVVVSVSISIVTTQTTRISAVQPRKSFTH